MFQNYLTQSLGRTNDAEGRVFVRETGETLGLLGKCLILVRNGSHLALGVLWLKLQRKPALRHNSETLSQIILKTTGGGLPGKGSPLWERQASVAELTRLPRALRDVAKPIGVSTYRVTRELPAPVRDELPAVEDLQEVVAKLRSEMEQLRKERQDE